MKKIIYLLVAACILFLSTGQTYANENIRVTEKFFKDWQNGAFTINSMIDPSTKQLSYSNEQMEINVTPLFGIHYAWEMGHINSDINKYYNNVVYRTSQGLLGGNAKILTVIGMEIKLKNLTQDVLYVDLNKSVLSVGNYYGRPLTGGIKYSEQANANLPPMVIPPNMELKNTLYRADYSLQDLGDQKVWQCPADLHPDNNLFGQGVQMLAIGDINAKYVTFQTTAVIPSSSFNNYLKDKPKK